MRGGVNVIRAAPFAAMPLERTPGQGGPFGPKADNPNNRHGWGSDLPQVRLHFGNELLDFAQRCGDLIANDADAPVACLYGFKSKPCRSKGSVPKLDEPIFRSTSHYDLKAVSLGHRQSVVCGRNVGNGSFAPAGAHARSGPCQCPFTGGRRGGGQAPAADVGFFPKSRPSPHQIQTSPLGGSSCVRGANTVGVQHLEYLTNRCYLRRLLWRGSCLAWTSLQHRFARPPSRLNRRIRKPSRLSTSGGVGLPRVPKNPGWPPPPGFLLVAPAPRALEQGSSR